jgi:hypothetical protein
VLDVYQADLAVTEFGDSLQKLDDLSLKPEIGKLGFWPPSVVGAHLQLLDHSWRRGEQRLAGSHLETLDTAKRLFLEQLDEQTSLV